jgi:hypothetical protein
LPDPEYLKRLAAALYVLILGTDSSSNKAIAPNPPQGQRSASLTSTT